VYLVNTGWSGGPYGVGKRVKLAYTRAMVRAAIKGDLEQVPMTPDPIFQVEVPESCPGVPKEILWPRNTWNDPEQFDRQARELARRFQENFAKFKDVPQSIRDAGPKAE
ncbi:MAG: phosphoenolpyruvate carboxykinase (ATP), partial [Planifilum fimeticola]